MYRTTEAWQHIETQNLIYDIAKEASTDEVLQQSLKWFLNINQYLCSHLSLLGAW